MMRLPFVKRSSYDNLVVACAKATKRIIQLQDRVLELERDVDYADARYDALQKEVIKEP